MLNEQLKQQIATDAEELTKGFKDTNDFAAGVIQGYKDGYEVAGEHYAALWLAAEEKAEKYEKALKRINDTGWTLGIQGCINVAYKALTPKTGEDGR